MMLTRIQELAAESKLRSALLLKHWGNYDVLTDSEFEELEQYDKFVELVINESIKVLMDNDYHGEWLGKKIKEHFRIE